MIALIAACAQNRTIGDKGKIPWSIKGEQKRFRELTTNNVVIMGRRTYEEIGRPLPDRFTIVVSRTKSDETEEGTTAESLQQALLLAAEKRPGKDIYIAGGAQLYREAVELADKIFLTEIHRDFAGDTFFPKFEKSDFEKEIICRVPGEIEYDYVTYTRKPEQQGLRLRRYVPIP